MGWAGNQLRKGGIPDEGDMKSRGRLFRVWLVLTGLWVANIVFGVFYAWSVEIPMIITIQWALEWAVILPTAILFVGWFILQLWRLITRKTKGPHNEARPR